MDQRSSIDVDDQLADDLLNRATQALKMGHVALATDLAKQAKMLAPYNPLAKQVLLEALQARSSGKTPAMSAGADSGGATSAQPGPRFIVPRGQEPVAAGFGASNTGTQSGIRRAPNRPEDASQGWRSGFSANSSRNSGSAMSPPREGTGSFSGLNPAASGKSPTNMRPYVPMDDRKGSAPIILPQVRDADSGPSVASRVADQALKSGTEILGLIGAFLRYLWDNFVTAAGQVTPRGLLLFGAYLALFSLCTYSVITGQRTFAMSVFQPLVQKSAVVPTYTVPGPVEVPVANRDRERVAGVQSASAASGLTSLLANQDSRSSSELSTPTGSGPQEPMNSGDMSLPSLSAGNGKGPTVAAEKRPLTRDALPKPKDFKAAINLAEEFLAQNQGAEALEILGPFEKKVPSVSRAGFARVQAQAHTVIGDRFFVDREFAKAAKSYQTAVALEPKNAAYHLYLGNALYHDGLVLREGNAASLPRFREAERAIEQSLKLSPDNFQALHRLATILEAQRRTTEARKIWLEVQKLAPPASNSAQAADLALKRNPKKS